MDDKPEYYWVRVGDGEPEPAAVTGEEGVHAYQYSKVETTRQWITGLAVIIATVVAYVGFSRLSVGWTLTISSVVLVGLVAFLWYAGRRKERP